jgi:hypothetical protein
LLESFYVNILKDVKCKFCGNWHGSSTEEQKDEPEQEFINAEKKVSAMVMAKECENSHTEEEMQRVV